MSRPSVLFIICDQLRADHLGFAGNTVVRTPNIDALAGRSVVFERAYVSNPICMPNRSTIMTGLMPSAHGVIFNDRSLDPSHTTFVAKLREAGWSTALIGKSHLQHGMSREAVVDLGRDAGRSSPFEEGWDTIEHQERYEAGEIVAPDDFYGFGHIDLTIGHGSVSGGHHYQWARDKGATHEQLVSGADPDADIAGRSSLWWQMHPAPFDGELYSTSFVTERTIAFIEESAGRNQPWMAWTSFPDPHHPLSPPEPWFSRHDAAEIVLPSTFDDPGAHWPEHLTVIRGLEPSTKAHQHVLPFGPTADQTRAAIAITYGMIEAIDDGIGQILATLERVGAADDTVVVFTSDHGDMMGDHGLILKGGMHFQGCLRIPLTVAAPGITPAHTTSLASSIDLPHTLLDLCDLPEYQSMQGHALTPILRDPISTVRDRVLVEDDFPSAVVRPVLPVKTRTVLTGAHRYSRDSLGQEQLYDLDADPDELHNLAVDGRDPTGRASMIEALADAMIEADNLTRTEPVSL